MSANDFNRNGVHPTTTTNHGRAFDTKYNLYSATPPDPWNGHPPPSATNRQTSGLIEDIRWHSSDVPLPIRRPQVGLDGADDSAQASLDDDLGARLRHEQMCSKERFSLSCPSGDLIDADLVSSSTSAFDPFATIQDDDDLVTDYGYQQHQRQQQLEENGSDEEDEGYDVTFDPLRTINDDDAFACSLPPVSSEFEVATTVGHIDPLIDDYRSIEDKKDQGVADVDQRGAASEEEEGEEDLGAEETRRSSVSSSSEEEESSVYEPLEPFHSEQKTTDWNLLVRLPLATRGNKLIMSQSRFWKPVFVKLAKLGTGFVLRLYSDAGEHELLHELPLHPSYCIYDEGLQPTDRNSSAATKCQVVTLFQASYEERLSVRSSNRTGFPRLRDITSISSFQQFRNLVHMVPKVSMVIEHSPHYSELLKFGGLNHDEVRQFQRVVEDALFRQEFRRQPLFKYGREELVVEVVDEYHADINSQGRVDSHKARVRIFCAAFLSGSPIVEVGINDERRNGKEVVSRRDIMALDVEDWISIEEAELSHCVSRTTYDEILLLRFEPLDGCRFELMRYRVRPIVDRELPLRVRGQVSVISRHVQIRCELAVPAYFLIGDRIYQTPCRDIQVRFPIPDSWIYLFHVERLFRYGAGGAGVAQAAKIPGAVKGLERLALFTQGLLQPSMIEVSTGSARYEDSCRAIIWKVDALPEREEGSLKHHTIVQRGV